MTGEATVISLVNTHRAIGRAITLLVVVVTLAPAPSAAQAALQPAAAATSPAPVAKKVLGIADYSKWRSIDGAQMSGDGRWVIYGLRFTNTTPVDAKPVLHILNLETNRDIEIPNATQAAFSADSRWVAYQIEPPGGGRGGRGGRGGGPPGADSATAPIVAPVVPPGGAPGIPPGSPPIQPTAPTTIPPTVGPPGVPGAPASVSPGSPSTVPTDTSVIAT